MSQSTLDFRAVPLPDCRDVLTEILRNGARQMLATAIEAEVADWIEAHAHIRDSDGHRQVVRNGSHPQRDILTGLGPIAVKQPRVLDRRPSEHKEIFRPSILPPYLRRTKNIEEAIPWLYLKGSAPAASPKLSKGSSASKPRGSRPTPSPGSNPPGRRNTGPGASGP